MHGEQLSLSPPLPTPRVGPPLLPGGGESSPDPSANGCLAGLFNIDEGVRQPMGRQGCVSWFIYPGSGAMCLDCGSKRAWPHMATEPSHEPPASLSCHAAPPLLLTGATC